MATGSLNRFLAGASIAVGFSMAGIVAGYFLAGRGPVGQPVGQPVARVGEAGKGETKAAEQPVVTNEVEAEGGGTSGAEEVAAGEAEAEAEIPPGDGQPAEGESETDTSETSGEAVEAVEPDAPAEPPPMKGDLYVEIRDIVGDARDKADIREIAKLNGGGIEACVEQHAPDQPRVIHNVQLAIGTNGKSTSSLLLQGAKIPELDACVEGVIAGWNYGAAEQPSFFKLKAVWSAP